VLETCRWCAAPLLGAIQPTSGGPGLVSAGFGSSLGGVAPALDPRQRSKERLDEGRAGVKLLRAGLQPASSVRPSSQPCHRANPRTTPLCRAPKNATARRALRLTVRLGSSPQRDHDGSSSRLVGEQPFQGVSPPSTSLIRAATHIGLTSPDFAAPSGFLNLVTPCSARTSTALFHAEAVPGVSCLQRFPPPARRHDFRRALPLLPLPAPRRRRATGIGALRRSVRVGSVLPGSQRSILS
jgi:hypothetical protein